MGSREKPSACDAPVGARLASPASGQLPKRKPVRYDGFDYRTEGAYFITAVKQGRKCIFGSIVDAMMKPTQRGLVVERCWLEIAQHRPNVKLDEFVVMPNHFHGVIFIEQSAGEASLAPTNDASPVGATLASTAKREKARGATKESSPIGARLASTADRKKPRGAPSNSLGAIIGGFKSAVTREINRLRPGAADDLWQRGYHDRIIRDKDDLNHIRNYIMRNPEDWWYDEENPGHLGIRTLDEFIATASSFAVEASLAPTGHSQTVRPA